MRALLRILIVIPFAYIAACIGAALIIFASGGLEPLPGETHAELAAKAFVVALIASMIVGAVAGIPALIMIVLAEAFGWRSLVLHLVVGAAIGLVAFRLHLGTGPIEDMQAAKIGAAAGAVGGFVYWLIAGRTAGFAPRRLREPASPPPA